MLEEEKRKRGRKGMATFGGVSNSALNNRMTPWHRGYGYGIAAVIKFPHRTRTRVTRFGNTAGISVPVLNPIQPSA